MKRSAAVILRVLPAHAPLPIDAPSLPASIGRAPALPTSGTSGPASTPPPDPGARPPAPPAPPLSPPAPPDPIVPPPASPPFDPAAELGAPPSDGPRGRSGPKKSKLSPEHPAAARAPMNQSNDVFI